VGPCISRNRANTLKQVAVGQNIHLAVRLEKIKFFENKSQNNYFYEGIVEGFIYLRDITNYYVRLSDIPQDLRKEVVLMKVRNHIESAKYN
jgi:ABC-type Fe3+/spermidine/putrescine transport system ATPase subunit